MSNWFENSLQKQGQFVLAVVLQTTLSNIFFFQENYFVLVLISQYVVPEDLIDNKSPLVDNNVMPNKWHVIISTNHGPFY